MGDTVWFERQPAHRTTGRNERNGFVEVVTEPWTCRWSYRENIRTLAVPAGYTWDGASVPRIAWTAIGITPGGLADGPSLAHDVLYRAAGGRKKERLCGCTIQTLYGVDVVVDRDEADWLFKEMCVFAGMRRSRAVVAYGAIRIFGEKYWGGSAPKIMG